MSLYGSMVSGILGLQAQTQAMSMISDNIANVNTVG
ncbi:flagellar basal body protein, partial [Acinetobacter baumannii]